MVSYAYFIQLNNQEPNTKPTKNIIPPITVSPRFEIEYHGSHRVLWEPSNALNIFQQTRRNGSTGNLTQNTKTNGPPFLHPSLNHRLAIAIRATEPKMSHAHGEGEGEDGTQLGPRESDAAADRTAAHACVIRIVYTSQSRPPPTGSEIHTGHCWGSGGEHSEES
ncbi:hypothetical protein BT63DRAFT_444488 [Microthyrium microscopicum]|uniref:Uncharacterized protein n=1 Tax=Microthyrium microscopicum TaxID=703497 RepID=A0A6A6TVJ4_9PEZI|nr:hypothetical protein BT63DRAFT_444488 [Microthyrium microscopicum]